MVTMELIGGVQTQKMEKIILNFCIVFNSKNTSIQNHFIPISLELLKLLVICVKRAHTLLLIWRENSSLMLDPLLYFKLNQLKTKMYDWANWITAVMESLLPQEHPVGGFRIKYKCCWPKKTVLCFTVSVPMKAALYKGASAKAYL